MKSVKKIVPLASALFLCSCISHDRDYDRTTLIGDSISHGAFAVDSRKNLWARKIESLILAGEKSKSYGFVPLSSIGEGKLLTTDIQYVSYNQSEWRENTPDSVISSYSPSGYSIRSTTEGAGISVTIPREWSHVQVNWVSEPGSGTMTVWANNIVIGEIDTSGDLGWKTKILSIPDGGEPSVSIYIKAEGSEPVNIVGLGYLNQDSNKVFNNYSQSGRQLALASYSVLRDIVLSSDRLIVALGHNDQVQADRDDEYFYLFKSKIDAIIEFSKMYRVDIVVPDFCWAAPESSRTRQQLKRLAKETGGTYIDLPSKLSDGGAQVDAKRLIDDLGMWWDPSHPNVKGHKWIYDQLESIIH